MRIEEFGEKIWELVDKDEESGGLLMLDDLNMWLHADGCLGASFNKVAIPCEERPWDEALDVIYEHIKKIKGQ